LETDLSAITSNKFYKKQQPDYKNNFVDNLFLNNNDSIKRLSTTFNKSKLRSYNKNSLIKLNKLDRDIKWLKISQIKSNEDFILFDKFNCNEILKGDLSSFNFIFTIKTLAKLNLIQKIFERQLI